MSEKSLIFAYRGSKQCYTKRGLINPREAGMYFDYKVLIPDHPKVSLKAIKGHTYVYYQYETHYDRNKKMSLPRRTTIGKQCIDDSKKMFPNESYLKYFKGKKDENIQDMESKMPVLSTSPRSSCLKVGTFIILKKLIHDYHLEPMLKNIIGEQYGLFLDIAVYTIITENNAAQYYPDYAYNHPLFTDDMKIYSDSTISSFLRSITVDDSVQFLNQWNKKRDHTQKIYISYDSTNKKCEAGDIDLVEVGHSKSGIEDTIFNYSIAYDQQNREPLFYENYSGSIPDVTQLEEMVSKAKALGYMKIGFLLDRGYFSEKNIHEMDENQYDFIIMVKGMKAMVKDIVLKKKGTFEDSYDALIPEYGESGITVKQHVFKGDQKDRYVHLYYNSYKAAEEREKFIGKQKKMREAAERRIGKSVIFPPEYEQYYDLIYWEGPDPKKKAHILTGVSPKKQAIEEGLKLCGYFCIITSENMNAKDALLLYKSRDDSEKLFRGDKSYLGNKSERVYSSESIRSKIFIEFVAMILRSKIYVDLIEQMKKENKRYNFMTVPAAIRELEKIEMIRYGNDRYRLDHAITKTQKEILKAFGYTQNSLMKEIDSLSLQIKDIDHRHASMDNSNQNM